MPVADELILEYLDNDDVMIFNVLYDEFQPYSCMHWGEHGNSNIPIIINDGTSMSQGGNNSLESLFFNDTSMPKHVFIDHELKVYYKDIGIMNNSLVRQKINEMLELKEEN